MEKSLVKNKFGIVTEYLPWLLLALVILVILILGIFVMRGEGESLIDKIKNIFSFR
jgi:uncharacterized membrane protein